jgi:hypothetical protein
LLRHHHTECCSIQPTLTVRSWWSQSASSHGSSSLLGADEVSQWVVMGAAMSLLFIASGKATETQDADCV